MDLIHERYPYKYVTCGTLEINGKPDCRILKYNEYTDRYQTMYYCDNMDQMMTAIEDFEYTSGWTLQVFLVTNVTQFRHTNQEIKTKGLTKVYNPYIIVTVLNT